MRNRSVLFLFVGLAMAVALIAAATSVAAGSSRDFNQWMAAQSKTPLLWVADGCALVVLVGSWLVGQTSSGASRGVSTRELDSLTSRIIDLEALTREQAARLENVEQHGPPADRDFEDEAARLTEQAFLALSDNIEANARQLETITMALRYQRAEMKTLRSALKTGELAPEGEAPSLETGPRPPRAVTPRLRKPEPEPEASIAAAPAEEPVAEAPEEATQAEETKLETAAEEAEVKAETSTEEKPEATDEPEPETQAEDPKSEADEEEDDEIVLPDSVTTLEIDVAKQRKDQQSAEVRAEQAAAEFRGSKQGGRSIFRKRH